MLAELAIANAAFKVIKTTLQNGKEIGEAGGALANYFSAEKEIQKQANSSKGDVLEAFQAKEALVRQEEDLKWMLNKSRLHGYQDFIAFKVQYTRDLREAEKEKVRLKRKAAKEMEDNMILMAKVMGGLMLVALIGFGLFVYLR